MKIALRTAEATLIYFAAMVVIFWAGGALRESLVLFGLDPLSSQIFVALLEALLLVSASGFVVRGLGVPSAIPLRACVGLGAVALVIVLALLQALFFLEYWARAITLSEGSSTAVALAVLAFAAVLPMFRGRS